MPREFTGSHAPNEIEGNQKENTEIEKNNLSFVLARQLVEKIKEREELNLNAYQRSCKFASLSTDKANLEPPWNIGELEGYLRFYRDLPNAFEESEDKNAEIFFCGSKYDVLVDRESEKDTQKPGIRTMTFRTPDGIVFRRLLSNTHSGTRQPRFEIVRRALPSN